MGAKIFYKKDRDRMDSMVDGFRYIPVQPPKYESEGSKAAAEVLKGYKPLRAVNTVTVRWHDGYMETFRATEVRFGCDLLWMRLEDGNNRHIPLRSVRWFGTSIESHQSTGF